MQIFKTMQEAESTDISRHPSYAQLSNEQQKEVNEVYRTAFLNNQGRVGYKIAEGIAYATAKELTEKYVGFKALAAKIGPGAAAAVGNKKYGKKAMQHAAKTGTSLKGHKTLGEGEEGDHGCPECGSSNITHHSFDFGKDSDTGYHDAGGRYKCADCGSEGDADDVKPMLDASHREMAKHKNFDEAENAPGEGDGEYPPGPYCGESEVTESEDEPIPGMKKTLNRNLLKYAAGHHIFCPSCENVLDHKNTVVMTNKRTGNTTVNCGDCHDKLLNKVGEKHGHDVLQKHLADTYDIVDGRPAKKVKKEKLEKSLKQPRIKGQKSFRFKPGLKVESVVVSENEMLNMYEDELPYGADGNKYPPGPYCGESEDDPEQDAGSSDVQKKNLSAKKDTGKEPKDVSPDSVHPPVPEKSDRKGAEDKAAADVKSHDDEAIQGAAAMLSKHGDDFMNKASEARADIKDKETTKFKNNWATDDKKDDDKKDDSKKDVDEDVILAAAKYIGYRQECAGKGAVMSESVDEGLLDAFKKKDMNRPGIHDYLKGRGFRQEGGTTKHLYGDHSGEGAAPEWQASYHHPKHKNTWVKIPAGNKGFELHHNNEIHKGHDADDLKRHMTLKVGNLS